MAEPYEEPLRLYGTRSHLPSPGWSWVEAQLAGAGTYWVAGRGEGHPHPRPVWGVWFDGGLHLSIGSPGVRRALAADPRATVHLDSGVDVVIVEGRVVRTRGTDDGALAAYDRKYTWEYDVSQYGDLTVVRAERVLAWCSAGPAGRDGFRATGRWLLAPATRDGPVTRSG